MKPAKSTGVSAESAPARGPAGTDARARRPGPPARDGLPTQADVARRAGVSTATVSRALNQPELVRPAVVTRIARIAQAMGHVPDSAGRALSSRRTRIAGVIVPTIDEPGLARSVESLQRGLEAAGHALMFASSGGDPERELAQARLLIGRGVEALVLAGTTHLPVLAELLAAQDIPVVSLDSFDPAWPGVRFDRRAAGAMAGHFLLDLGHTRLALLTSVSAGGLAAAEWTAGIVQALSQRGLAPPEGGALILPQDLDAARAAMRELLAGSLPPTAVVCDHDILALGALRECVAQGIAVPGRLSLVGCGDFDFAQHSLPPLTTLRVPVADLGRLAAERLLEHLAGETAPRRNVVSAKLVIRGSAGRPPAG